MLGSGQTPPTCVSYTGRMKNRPAPAPLQGGVAQRTADVFEHLSEVPLDDLLEILHGAGQIPTGLSAKAIRDRICILLGVRVATASRLLGVSNRRYPRNDTVTPEMLDRTYILADTYAHASSKLGDEAAEWLSTTLEPHDRTPLEIIGTWFGWQAVKRELAALPAP